MIYLIAKMAVYLLLALGLGGGAGWLLCQYLVARREEQSRRDLHDTQAKIPQLESAVRSRDAQLEQFKERLAEKQDELKGMKKALREAEEAARSNAPKVKKDFNPLLDETPGAPADENAARLEAELADARATIDQLTGELRDARSQADAQATASAGTSEGASVDPVLARQIKDLELRLRQRAVECQMLEDQLAQEQRKVLELERERELQNKSLMVLHQQLEVARDRPSAH